MSETTEVRTRRLREYILSEYKSVRKFAAAAEIPYSTLVTALERGVDGMAYGTVMRICEVLHLNPIDFTPLNEGGQLADQITAARVSALFLSLNNAGRTKVLELMEDYGTMEKYTSAKKN